jgi:UDP:flavonoid glycosyltransferase YjiC (YdhE family)
MITTNILLSSSINSLLLLLIIIIIIFIIQDKNIPCFVTVRTNIQIPLCYNNLPTFLCDQVRLAVIKAVVLPLMKLKAKLGFTTPGWNIHGAFVGANAVIVNTIAGVEYPFTHYANTRCVGPCLGRGEIKEISNRTEMTIWLESKPEIVYIGLGTMTLLPERAVNAYLELARCFPKVSFLFKVTKESFQPKREDVPSNVRIEAFLPSQLEVIAHPNVKVRPNLVRFLTLLYFP